MAFGPYERLKHHEDESETVGTIDKDLRVTIREYVFLTQKIAWCQMTLPEAILEVRNLSRKLAKDDFTGAAVGLKTVLSETADIWQRIQLTLFRLFNESDDFPKTGAFGARQQRKGRRKVVCSVPLRFEKDLTCGLEGSTIRFYWFF